jgi:TP901 family phage tail tape measure protein
MRVQVRVLNGATPEIKAITAALNQMAASVAKANGMMAKQMSASSRAATSLTGNIGRTSSILSRFHGGLTAVTSGITKFGKNIQWSGRQIEYNFTLPIIIAGAAATKWAMDQEKAFVRVRKVYGDQTAAIQYWKRQGLSANQAMAKSNQVMNKELEALDKNFTALSNAFGVNKAEVNNIAADWAAAGASGAALAKSTRLTMEAMILGEMDATTATKSLIAIQAQYGANTKNLMHILGALNAVENGTGATMGDLITAFEKSAGAARSAGVDYRHLAADVAALVPASGSAANAGNALKTLFSRVLAPTSDAITAMKSLGLNINTVGWQSKNGQQRLMALADAMKHSTNNTKNAVAAYVASRYQVNRFDILMRELTSDHGYYAKALDMTNSKTKIAALYQRELTQVLSSQPQQFQMIKERMRNALVQAIIPFIPAILSVADGIAKLAQSWQNLNPTVQKAIVIGLLAIAAYGTLMRLFGAFLILLGTLGTGVIEFVRILGLIPITFAAILSPVGKAMSLMGTIVFSGLSAIGTFLVEAMGGFAVAVGTMWTGIVGLFARGIAEIRTLMMTRLLPAMFGPWGILVAGIVAAAIAFRNKIGDAIKWIIDAFGHLPQGVANAISGVINVLSAGVKVVMHWLSYLNPFARHSPSLVDNVRAGMKVVRDHHAQGAGVAADAHRAAAGALDQYGAATGRATTAAQRHVGVQRRMTAATGTATNVDALGGVATTARRAAGGGAGGGAGSSGAANIDKMKTSTKALRQEVNGVNKELEAQKAKLQHLQDISDRWQKALTAAQDQLSHFLDSPLKGEKEMQQRMLDNQVAQAKLKLQMMKFEEVTGPIDKVQSRLDALAGDMEMLRGKQAELRSAGAGSDILKPYQDQINALDKQQTSIDNTVKQYNKMQDALDGLQHQADKMDLQNFINFDSVHQQAQLFANTMKEISAPAMLAGVKKWAPEVARLQKRYDAASAAVDRQQHVVDLLQRRYDKLNGNLDKATASLKKHTAALKKAKAAASGSGGSLSPAEQAMKTAKLGNFKESGLGAGLPMRKDWSSQVPDIEKLTRRLTRKAQKSFGSLDIFGGLKDQIKQGWKWIVDHTPDGVKNFVQSLKDNIKNVLATAGIGALIGNAIAGPVGAVIGSILGAALGSVLPKNFFSKTLGVIVSFAKAIAKPFIELWGIIGPEVIRFGKMIGHWFADIFGGIVDAFHNAFDGVDWQTFGKQMKMLFQVLKPLFAAIVLSFKIIANVFIDVLKPVLDLIANVFKNTFGIIFDLVALLIDIMTGNWSDALSQMGDIAKRLLSLIIAPFKAIFGVIIGVVRGVVVGIISWFKWMHDNGPPWVAKMIDGIAWFFKKLGKIGVWLYDHLIKPVVDAFKWLWNELVGHSIIPDIIDGIIFYFKILAKIGKWIWDHVVTPIFKFFKAAWPIISKIIGYWWTGFTTVLKILWKVAQWVWDHVLHPIIRAIAKVWGWIAPLLKAWWTGFKMELKLLWKVAKWIWDHVLHPIVQAVKKVWTHFIKPALHAWWTGFKTTLKILWKLAKWIWDHVLKPVWDRIKSVWNDHIKPFLKNWWKGFTTVLKTLWKLGKWVWDHVLHPVLDRVKSIWNDHIKPFIRGWWQGFKNTLDNLKQLGKWFHDHVLQPLFDKVKSIWNSIHDWLSSNKDKFINPMKSAVNGAIGAVNKLIEGLNKVAKALPGISWDIKLIPKFAAGGPLPLMKRVGAGFKTNGPRAIVGEGRSNHPEYVIPTDPSHRKRARALLASAAQRLGGIGGESAHDGKKMLNKAGYGAQSFYSGLPAFGLGGIIGDLAKSAWNSLKDHAKHAVSFLMNPFINKAQDLIPGLDYPITKGLAKAGIDKIIPWVSDFDTIMEKKIKAAGNKYGGGDALKWARSQVGKPYVWGGVGPGGYDCSGFMSAITNKLRGNPPHSRVGSTASFPWSGFTSGHGGRFTIGSTKNYGGSGVGHMAGTLAGVNVESAGGVGVRVGKSARGWNDGGFTTHAYLAQNGAYIRRRAGGVLARVGEGKYDEAVVPLPHNIRERIAGDGGKREVNIYGDLSFPNIKTGADAEKLVENLELLAKD